MTNPPIEITEVRVQLNPSPQQRVRAFCSVTFADQFVVRDLKVIWSESGEFVAMPSRKLADRCDRCGEKNALRARFCNQCGAPLDPDRALGDPVGRPRLHADLAHPINRDCRRRLERAVLEAYRAEIDASRLDGYVPKRLDDFEDDQSEQSAEDPHRKDMVRGDSGRGPIHTRSDRRQGRDTGHDGQAGAASGGAPS